MSNRGYLILISLTALFPLIVSITAAALGFNILGTLGIITLVGGVGCFVSGFFVANAEPQAGGGNAMAAFIIFIFGFLCIVAGFRLGALTALGQIFKMLF